MTHLPIRVIVAGGGVAGLQTCLALQALAGHRARVTLIAPNRYFGYRPISVRDPLAVRGHVLVPVWRLARAARADLRPDRIASVDPAARRVRTTGGYELPYDALVLCVGADPEAVPARAEPFDAQHTAGCRVLMHRLREGQVQSLAFVEPAPPAHAFDLYDLALETAVSVRRAQIARDLVLITAASAPLAILGARAAAMLHSTLGAHGIRVVESSYVRSIGAGEIELAPQSRRIAADRVIALPRLGGPWLDHLPRDRDGFLPVDPHGRVPRVDGVYAAGDCTSFPVKHPSLAAQQADAVAAAIAAGAGIPVAPEPFRPILRGLLPSRLRWYVDAPLTGGEGHATIISALRLWSSQLRFDARFLGARLERRASDARGHFSVSTASPPTDATTTAMLAP
jgi:sulfide:quinone oxidoreductase